MRRSRLLTNLLRSIALAVAFGPAAYSHCRTESGNGYGCGEVTNTTDVCCHDDGSCSWPSPPDQSWSCNVAWRYCSDINASMPGNQPGWIWTTTSCNSSYTSECCSGGSG
jgi:hypothetical protein